MPQSLRGRLLLVATFATGAALIVAAFAIGHVLERFVIAGIDQRLDASLGLMASTVRGDGSIDEERLTALQPGFAPDSGWNWRIDTPRAHRGSIDADQFTGPLLPPREPERRHRGRDEGETARPTPLDGQLSDRTRFHARRMTVPTSAGPAVLLASAPRDLVERPIRGALTPLLGTLAILGAVLALATLIQLHIGLKPLDRLRRTLAAVRSGQDVRVPDDQPRELLPLTRELNALLDQNAAQLANARGHVANLAHGLKTPLASLALELREGGRDPDGTLAAHVARIDGAIRHHLGRARADSAGGARPRVPLAPAIEGLVAALSRIHADRPVTATVSVAPDLSVGIDPHDLDELLGNLLDNGWRFAATRIAIDAAAQGGIVRIAIADDGPGIPADRRDAAMQPGRRLDEVSDGHGFGLSIARELAELHGGRLILAEAAGGGLIATVELPD
ncbi:sensor histidine kinase [Sphingomonas panacisoli]|nr:HAMP domain-containing sensor histidine kinase [Sphingomonas panacisoli]